MAVKIRLRRVGAKKQPAYRLVVADARSPRDGRFIEIIGHYNPLSEPSTVEIKSDRALFWLQHGAQPTDVVRKMLVKKGIWKMYSGEETAVIEAAVPEAEEAAPISVVVSPTAEIVEAAAEEAAVVAPVEEAPVAEETAALIEEMAPAAAEEAAVIAPVEEAPVAVETIVVVEEAAEAAAPTEETPAKPKRARATTTRSPRKSQASE